MNEEEILRNGKGQCICERAGRFNEYLFSYGSDRYVFTAPTKLYDTAGRDISVKWLRDKQLLKDSTNQILQEIDRKLTSTGKEIIQEVVILIDREEWRKSCAMYGVDKNFLDTHAFDTPAAKRVYQNHYNKTHLRLDWLLPDFHLNIEHDGSSYHVPLLDEIRDKYLTKMFPDLKIIRIQNYSKRKEKELDNIIHNNILMSTPKEFPLILRYEERVLKAPQCLIYV